MWDDLLGNSYLQSMTLTWYKELANVSYIEIVLLTCRPTGQGSPKIMQLLVSGLFDPGHCLENFQMESIVPP
jgi:hypothetical protein